MSSGIEKLPGEPITLYTAPAEIDLSSLAEGDKELRKLWDQQAEPVYHIVNYLAVAQLDLDKIARIAADAAYGDNSLFRHPKLKEVLFLTTNQSFATAAQGLKSGTYGNVPISVFGSLEEALSYIREKVRQSR